MKLTFCVPARQPVNLKEEKKKQKFMALLVP